jgi:hypothetical protein
MRFGTSAIPRVHWPSSPAADSFVEARRVPVEVARILEGE